MSDKQKHIDQLFKDKLENFEMSPDPSVWNSIEASLEKKRRKNAFIWLQRSGVAAVVAIAFALGWYFSSRTIESPIYSEVQNEYLFYPFVISANEPTNLKIAKSDFKRIDFPLRAFAVTKRMNLAQNSLQQLDTKSAKIQFKDNLTPELVKPKGDLSEIDRQIIAMNLSSMEQQSHLKKSQGKWIVGAQVAPSLAFKSGSKDNEMIYADFDGVASRSSLYSGEYKSTFAGVVNVAYEQNNRLKFETGVGYRTLTQDLGSYNITNQNSNLLSFSNSFVSDLKSAAVNNITVNTDLGVATVALPNGAQVSSMHAEVVNSAKMNADFEDFKVNQYANYLEIPFNVVYKLIDKRIDINAIGGINTNILLNDYLTLNGTSKNYKGGEIIGLNAVSFSSNLGMGFEYDLMRQIRISLEPIMKIQLSSLNSSSQFEARPLTFGLYSGLRYVF